MELTSEGIQNVINLVKEYTQITIDEQFVISNYDKFAERFPEADDVDYCDEYGDDVWWTFAAEANGGSIDDTSPRDAVIDTVAEILFGTAWPLNGDSFETREAFNAKLDSYLESQGS